MARGEPLFIAGSGLLIAEASHLAEHRLQGTWALEVAAHGPYSMGAAAVVHKFTCLAGIWDLPGPAIKPMSPTPAGGSSAHCTTREVLTLF